MKRGASLQRRRVEESRGLCRFGSPPRRRWPSVVVVVVCVGVGAALLERWSRPGDGPEQDQAAMPEPSHEEAPKPPPISLLPATDEELIAQTKKMGARLAEDFAHDPRAITLAGHICWALDEPAKGIALWRRSVQLDPGFAAAWSALGMDAFRKGDFEKAAEYFDNSYRRTPQMTEGDLFMMTEALMNTGRPEAVVAVLEPLRKAQPASVRAAVTLGCAYLQLKKYEQAKKELLEAAALAPRWAKAHFALAQVFARLGDETNARKHREEYARLKAAEMAVADSRRVDRLKEDLLDLHSQAARFFAWSAEIYARHGRVDEADRLGATSLALDRVKTRRDEEMPGTAQGRGEEARESLQGRNDAPTPVRKQ